MSNTSDTTPAPLAFPDEWRAPAPSLDEDPAIDPVSAALTLLAHVKTLHEAVDADPTGATQPPSPSDVANLYARAQVYATLALTEAVDGVARLLDERT